jgi:hypothetical protein
MSDAPNISETRAVLRAIAASALEFAQATELLSASLSAQNLDAETLGDLMDVFEATDGVIRLASRTLDNLNRRHLVMEEAVNATPKVAKTEFYRADGNSGHRGVVNVATGNANVAFQIGQQFSQPTPEASNSQTDASQPSTPAPSGSTNNPSGSSQSDGGQRGTVNVASGNARVAYQVGRQFPKKAKEDADSSSDAPPSSEATAGKVVNVQSGNARVGMQTDVVIGDLRIDL